VSQFWQVEHAYPSQLPGWLVIVLRRHVEALHEIKPEEFRDLTSVLERTVRVLHEVLTCEKEYVACFAELEHFKHVHFHVIPRAADMPAHLLGTQSFALLKVSETDAVPPAEIRWLCGLLSRAFGELETGLAN
jgi:diadenosine tetraphosphate (Ap4A) HIT family hydrolase